jgi:hypothetical protein
MFDEDPGRVLELPTVVAVTATGVERLSQATRELCDEVAARVDGPSTFAVVVERYDTVAWAADPTAPPLDRRTVARCRNDR